MRLRRLESPEAKKKDKRQDFYVISFRTATGAFIGKICKKTHLDPKGLRALEIASTSREVLESRLQLGF